MGEADGDDLCLGHMSTECSEEENLQRRPTDKRLNPTSRLIPARSSWMIREAPASMQDHLAAFLQPAACILP